MDEQSPGPKWSRLDWWFRSRQTGQVTVAQFPNIPLWIFLVTIALGRLVPAATAARTAVNLVGLGALCWWALDEVLGGGEPVAALARGRRLRHRRGRAGVVSALTGIWSSAVTPTIRQIGRSEPFVRCQHPFAH